MPDLIAQGPTSEDRWRREVPSALTSREIVIGRSEADWNVPWDTKVSRAHVGLKPLGNGRVQVRRLKAARNPVFHCGGRAGQFTLVPGDHFVIGSTTFTLANRPGASDSSDLVDVTEHAYDHAALRRRHFRDAASRIEVLSRLPDLITNSGSDEELLVRVIRVMLQAIPSASAVAIVAVSADDCDSGALEVLHYDSRVGGREGAPVSAGLARSAIDKRESVLHLWAGNRDDAAFTASDEVDWAFCVPLRSEACRGWGLYVTGPLTVEAGVDLEQSLEAAPDDLQDDVKFAELVGTTLANLRQSRRLERRQAAMRHFFAPVVMEALAGKDTDEVLAPREANLSVMFCDLRSFSQRSERRANDLLSLLASVSDSLGVMTRHILDNGGVIGDFHGDAAMGFWGWPLEQPDAPLRSAEAANQILADNGQAFRDVDNSGFRFGIGIATGRAVAGRIGTVDQVKVTAFGPVVNLASRLEGLTKVFGAEVIIDKPTAEALQNATENRFRVRRLAHVRPAGFDKSAEVFELMVRSPESSQRITDEQIQQYEEGLEAFIDGDWEEAYRRLHELPAWDRPKDVLLSIVLSNNRVPPDHWNGVIELPK
ncbi:MAG: adenylate/guanylate cyclase domain-containing protein [Rubripirellula sp.]|nr:adenylate/guanylate cyclase domain-containing protein [Rubripirellula sp.]